MHGYPQPLEFKNKMKQIKKHTVVTCSLLISLKLLEFHCFRGSVYFYVI